jgi:hypothetical protein
MTDDKKLSVADLEERLLYDDDDGAASGIDVRQLLTILVLHWRWFVFSVVLCLAGAVAYLRYTTAVYSLSARMLLKDDKQNPRSSADALANMYDLGFMTNSTGIENEMQILCRADYTHKTDIKIVNTLAAEQKLLKPCTVLNGIDMSKRKHGYYYGYGFYGRYGRYAYSHYGNNNDKSIKR